jgi:hypothetical protein
LPESNTVHHARRDEAAILGLDAALRSLMRWFGWCRQTRTEAQRKRSYDQDRRHQRQRLAGVETRAVIASSIARIAERTGARTHLVAVADLVPDLGIALRTAAWPRLEDALAAMGLTTSKI